jgi:hypothetical protein
MGSQASREIELAEMAAEDWPMVRAIYLEGIATGNATFEKSAPEWPAWDAAHLKSCRFVARAGNDVVGWAALSAVSGWCVYSGVAEVSVYVAESARRRNRSAAAGGAGGSVRKEWNLDAAGGDFPRKRGEHRGA